MAARFKYDIYCSCDIGTTPMITDISDKLKETLQKTYKVSIVDYLKKNYGIDAEDYIKDSRLMICFLTQQYSKHRTCSDEINIANELGRKVIYVLLEELDVNKLQIKDQIFDKKLVFDYYYQNNENQYKKMSECIETILKPQPKKRPMLFDFFMSHQTKCKAIVIEICDLLTAKGYKSWLDKEQLYFGDELHAKLAEGILDSEYFFCFLSKLYIESYNCELEYKYALSKRKPALFILLEKLEIPPGLEIYMSNSMRLDAYKESGELKSLNDKTKKRLMDSIDRLKRNGKTAELNEETSELLKLSTKIRGALHALKSDLDSVTRFSDQEQKRLRNMHETIEYQNEDIDKHKTEISEFNNQLNNEEVKASQSYQVSKFSYDSDIESLYEQKKLAMESLKAILSDQEDMIRKEDELTQALAALSEDQMKNMHEQYDLLMFKGSKMKAIESSKMEKEYLTKRIKAKELELERLSKQIKFLREKQKQISNELDSIDESIKNYVPKVKVEYNPMYANSEEAAGFGYKNIVELLLSKNANIEAKDIKGNTGLLRASLNKQKNMVILLVSKGADINVKNDKGETVLMNSLRLMYDQSVLELLLNKGVDVNAADDDGNTALIIASNSNLKEAVELLVKANADIEAKNKEGKNAIYIAVEKDHKEIEDILKAARKPQYKPKYQTVSGAVNNGHLEDLKYWIGKDQKKNWDYGSMLVQAASLNEKTDVMEYLLSLVSANPETAMNIVNTVNAKKQTALICASEQGKREMVELLLRHNAGVDFKDGDSNTALHLAAKGGHLDVVSLLLPKCTEMETVNKDGLSPLMCASKHESVENLIKSALEERYKNYNPDNNNIGDAIIYGNLNDVKYWFYIKSPSIEEINNYLLPVLACSIGHINIIDYLLNRNNGCIEAIDEEGCTPLIRASMNGCTNVVEYLLDKNASIEAKNKHGQTALIRSSNIGHIDVVKMLINEKANIEAKDNEGFTALDRATQSGRNDVVEFLQKTMLKK